MERGWPKKISVNVLWNFIGQGWLLVLALFATPIIVHRLEVVLYGIYVLVAVVVDYFAFLQLGMGTAAVKYIAEFLSGNEKERIRAIFWSGMFAHLFMGLVGTILLFFLAGPVVDHFLNVPPSLRETAVFAIRVGSLGFLVSMLSGMASSVIRARARFDLLNLTGIILGSLQIAAAVVLLLLGYSLKAVIAANVTVQAVGFVSYWVIARRLLPCIAEVSWDRPSLVMLLKFGGFVTVSSIVGPVLTNIEKILLTTMRSVSSLTYYAVPFSLLNRLSVIPSSFSSVLFPAFSYLQRSEGNKLNRALHDRSTLYLFLIYGAPLAFFVFFGGSFLDAWVGRDFAEQSTGVLIVLCIAGMINALAYPSMAALQGMGRPQLPAFFHVAELLVYIPAAYFLIRDYGIQGAAYAWLFRVLLDTLLLHGAACRLFDISLARWYGRILYRGLAPIAALFCLLWVLKRFGLPLLSFFNMAGIVLIYAAYLYALWRWILDEDIKEIVYGWIKGG